MKWIKHMTATSRDEKIARLVGDGSVEGMARYGLYWRVNEIIGEQMEGASPSCSVSYPISVWSRLLPMRGSLVAQSLMRLGVADESSDKAPLITVERTGDDIRVTNRNLLKYRDEYARKSGQTPKDLPAPPPKKAPDTKSEEAIEREKQEEMIYNSYPRKVAKPAAVKAIRAAVKRLVAGSASRPSMQEIDARRFLYARTKAYAESPAGSKPPPGGEDYRPHPATWFNQERYDNPAEWQRPNGGSNGKANATGSSKSERNLANLREAIGAGADDHGGAGAHGHPAGWGSGGALFEGHGGQVIDARLEHGPAGD